VRTGMLQDPGIPGIIFGGRLNLGIGRH